MNLHEPPYLAYLELLQQVREHESAWARVQYAEARDEQRGRHDLHELERARLAHILLLHATARDLPLLRFLLDQENTARRSDDFQGGSDTLTILSLLLAEHGDSSDSWRFWLAKRANFDTWAGGYDVEFVLTWLSPEQLRELIAQREPEHLEMLERYDLEAVSAGRERWRQRLSRMFPRTREAMGSLDCEAWAELFGDRAGMERYGMENARTPDARARLFARLGRYEEAVDCWREVARSTDDPWDQISALTHAVSHAARVPLATLSEVEQIDRLRAQVPSWPQVGLGRMATESCYELAAAVTETGCGRELWRTAQRWRAGLEGFSLVGLQKALAAGQRWGQPQELLALQQALEAERARISA